MTTLKPSKRRRVSSHLSLRLTSEERARLEKAAAGRTLSEYIRSRMFDAPQNPDASSAVKSPESDDMGRLSPEERQRLLAQILGLLGRSLALGSLTDLAEAARIGVLPLSADTLADIRGACAAILEMRQMLLRGLGLRPVANRDDP